MPISPTPWIGAACAVCILWLTACSTAVRTPSHTPTVALAVRVDGGKELSAQQFFNVQDALRGPLAAAGYQYASETRSSDFIVRVRFTADVLDPKGGHVAVLGVEPNSLRRPGADGQIDEAEAASRKQLRDLENLIKDQTRTARSEIVP